MHTLQSCVILMAGFIVSIFIFLNGFLMNRSEIHEVNICHNNLEYCKYAPYKKIVLLLVDALKYEFIDPTLNQTNNYQGYLDIFNSKKLSKKGKYVYLNHFISDPPTTTLQRIKGITTGSLPTFIDISTNFGSSELIEDNIINQWQKFDFDIKFVGDDTWTHLFPGKFNKSESYPSFNVKDLDSVDRGVEKFILNSLSTKTKSSNQKPEILVGHMLGIDHCGHTYGKNHAQMKRKLIELNDFLKKIVTVMDGETLLLVFGDHGMTPSGDHGGESDEEVDAALAVISGKPLNYHRQSAEERLQLQNLSQIDLVPTLAALTGVAIPFSNLGVLRPEMVTSLARSNQYLEMNINQISQYVDMYESKFGSLHLPGHIRDFLTHPNHTSITEHSISFLRTIQTHFRSKWAQFNVTLIHIGILGCILHLLSLLSHICDVNYNGTSYMKWRYTFYLSLICLHTFITPNSITVLLFVTLSIVECVLLLWKVVAIPRNTEDILQVAFVLIGCAYILVPLSNSFIVSEDRIVQYFLQTVLLVKTLQCFVRCISTAFTPKGKRADKIKSSPFLGNCFSIFALFALGTIFLILGMSFKICREEQRSWCDSEVTSGPRTQLVILIMPLLLLGHRVWLQRCGNLDSNDLNVLNVKILLPFSGVCLFFHQCIQLVDDTSRFTDVAKATGLIFPRLALLSSVGSLLSIVVSPLLMFHRARFDNVHRVDVPALFRYLREWQTDSADSIIVHGLASIYSSAIFTALLAACIAVVVFLKVPFVLGLAALLGFLFVYSVLSARLVESTSADVCASYPVWETAMVMTLLTQYGFFGTGHQATISNIPWYAAFVGWSGDHATQLIPAIMVNVNVFCAHIVVSLCGLLVPLLVLLISVGPANPFHRQSTKKRDGEEKALNLGEFYLFKSDEDDSRFCVFLRRYFVVYLWCQSIVTLGAIISAGYGRRHLMAWKIFVPKMLYSVLALFIVYLATVLGYLLIRRIHRAAVSWRRINT